MAEPFILTPPFANGARPLATTNLLLAATVAPAKWL